METITSGAKSVDLEKLLEHDEGMCVNYVRNIQEAYLSGTPALSFPLLEALRRQRYDWITLLVKYGAFYRSEFNVYFSVTNEKFVDAVAQGLLARRSKRLPDSDFPGKNVDITQK